MDEKKEEAKQETKEEAEVKRETDKDNDDGNAAEEESIPKAVKEAKEAAATIKAENDRREKLIEKEDKMISRKEALGALGGGSIAGSGEVKEKEETPTEYKDRVMKNEL